MNVLATDSLPPLGQPVLQEPQPTQPGALRGMGPPDQPRLLIPSNANALLPPQTSRREGSTPIVCSVVRMWGARAEYSKSSPYCWSHSSKRQVGMLKQMPELITVEPPRHRPAGRGTNRLPIITRCPSSSYSWRAATPKSWEKCSSV